MQPRELAIGERFDSLPRWEQVTVLDASGSRGCLGLRTEDSQKIGRLIWCCHPEHALTCTRDSSLWWHAMPGDEMDRRLLRVKHA